MSDVTTLMYVVLAASVLALGFAYYFYRWMLGKDEGTELMKKIASHVRKGAMAYLKQQYKVVTIVFVVLAVVFAVMAYFNLQNGIVWFAFLTGGFFSGLAGFFGMKTATYASARTANAARQTLNAGLQVAFRSGAVMGLTVVGLALLDISGWFLILQKTGLLALVGADADLITITTTMLTFGMGASTQALFARVGGGIYTKAADVGADLVGKTEAGIPEDDPRNPATIADNVGDNVGDVAGMGADLFDLPWVQSTINLFVLFGWSLYAAGIVVAVFDVAIEYQSGRANIKTTALNILKGFFACSLIGVVPIELYKFCISLQNSLARDLSIVTADVRSHDLGATCTTLLTTCFSAGVSGFGTLFMTLCMIAFAYCVIKIFFANIKRGGRLML